MASKKLYSIKKEFIKEVPNVFDSYYSLTAFAEGYAFLRNQGEKNVYMVSPTSSMKTLKVEMIDVSIVEKKEEEKR